MSRMVRVLTVSFFLLSLLACLAGACLPWFEYQITWNPQRVFWPTWILDATVDWKQVAIFEYGPDLYPLLSQGGQGCYVAGVCGTSTMLGYPNRLHVADLTSFQLLLVQSFRAVGLLACGANLAIWGWGLVRLCRWCLARCREGQWRHVLVATLSLVAGVVGLIVILVLFGPVIGDVVAREPLPGWGVSCQAAPPPDLECAHGGWPGYQPPTGEARWTFGRVLPLGPALVGGSLVLAGTAVILHLRARKAAANSPAR